MNFYFYILKGLFYSLRLCWFGLEKKRGKIDFFFVIEKNKIMPINIYITRKIEKKKQANPNVKYIHNYTL